MSKPIPFVINSDNKNKAYALRNMISDVDLTAIHRSSLLGEVIRNLNNTGENNQENIDVSPYVDLSNLCFTVYTSGINLVYPHMSFGDFAGYIAEVYAIARGRIPGGMEVSQQTIKGYSNNPANPFSVEFNRKNGMFTFSGVVEGTSHPVRLFDGREVPTLSDLLYTW